MKTNTILIALLSAVLLSACIKPYRPDIQQGNIINNSDLREIRYAMSKQEVLFILGTPMVIDPFNESRWDYYYSNINQRKSEVTTRIITARFDGDELVALEGDIDLASVEALEPSTEDQQHGGTVITEPTHKEKGFLNRMKFFKKLKNRQQDKKNKKDS